MATGGVGCHGETRLHLVEIEMSKLGILQGKYPLGVWTMPQLHQSIYGQRSIYEHFAYVCTDWPGNSSDLNHIEDVWSKLKEGVLT